jgi:salicylate hydroxylase
MTASAPVLIAGGGIGGLATAIALAGHGIPSRVLEKRSEFSEAGAGIQLGPNGVKVLRRLGIDADLAPSVGRPREIRVYSGASGAGLTRLPLGDWIEARHGAPYWVAHRQDLQSALLAGARRSDLIQLMPGFDVVRYSDQEATVRAEARDGASVDGRALVCADGVVSQLRAQIAPGARLRFAGKTAARTVLDAAGAHAILDAGAIGVWMAPNAHVVHYPVRAGREIAVVVIIDENWQEEGWSAPADPAKLRAALAPFAPALRTALAPATDWRRWALFDCDPFATWKRGRVVLLGDAAHPLLPFLAQGGSLALEDAVTLADALGGVGDDIERALAAYEQARRAHTARVMATARRNGRVYHLSGIAALARNAVLRALSPERIMAGYDWVYGWKA